MGNKNKRTLPGITKAIFLAIAEIARVGAIAFSRRSLLEKEILIEYGYLPWQINSTLRRFERSGYMTAAPDNKLKLSPKGQTQAARYTIEDIQAPPRPDSWDWKWRILIFDIPEQKKWAREMMRGKLREWHFALLQRSVYISPFDCVAEFEELLAILRLNPYVHIILAESISASLERHFISHFKLSEFFEKET